MVCSGYVRVDLRSIVRVVVRYLVRYIARLNATLYRTMERICSDCGKTFDGRADAQFCSDACRIRTRRKQKLVVNEVENPPEAGVIPEGMVLINERELAQLQAKAARVDAEIGPSFQINYSKLINYMAYAKQHFREHYPKNFEEKPFDIDGMLDVVFGTEHRGKLPSMTFTVNVNPAKSALTPD